MKAINQAVFEAKLTTAVKHDTAAANSYTDVAVYCGQHGIAITQRAALWALVVPFVQREQGVKAHKSRKGEGMTFTKDTKAYDRAKYLVEKIIGKKAQGRKAKQADPVAKFASAVKSAKSAGLTKAQALKAFERAWTA